MKRLLRQLVFLLIILIGIVIPTTLVNAKEGIQKTDNGYFVKNNKTYKVNLKTLESKEIFNHGGIISNDRNKIAYKESKWNPKKKLLIADLKTNEVNEIELSFERQFEIVSWSPDDKYIILTEHSHYVGGTVAYIIDTRTGNNIVKISTLGLDFIWIDSKNLAYIDPNYDCFQRKKTNECSLDAFLKILNTDNKNVKTVHSFLSSDGISFQDISIVGESGNYAFLKLGESEFLEFDKIKNNIADLRNNVAINIFKGKEKKDFKKILNVNDEVSFIESDNGQENGKSLIILENNSEKILKKVEGLSNIQI